MDAVTPSATASGLRVDRPDGRPDVDLRRPSAAASTCEPVLGSRSHDTLVAASGRRRSTSASTPGRPRSRHATCPTDHAPVRAAIRSCGCGRVRASTGSSTRWPRSRPSDVDGVGVASAVSVSVSTPAELHTGAASAELASEGLVDGRGPGARRRRADRDARRTIRPPAAIPVDRRRRPDDLTSWRSRRPGSHHACDSVAPAPGAQRCDASRAAMARLPAWSGASTGSRTSTASPARCAASDGSAPTRSPATCSAGSCRWGRSSQRVPPERCPAVPRRGLAPRVRHARVRLALRPRRARQGGRADPRAAGRVGRAAPRARKAIRGTIYLFKNNTDSAGNSYGCHENYLTSRARRPRPLRRGADPVPRQPPDLHRRRQGAADRPGRDVLDRPARRAHLGGRVVGAPPAAGRSSTPATSRTPTPRSTAASTSSSATRT